MERVPAAKTTRLKRTRPLTRVSDETPPRHTAVNAARVVRRNPAPKTAAARGGVGRDAYRAARLTRIVRRVYRRHKTGARSEQQSAQLQTDERNRQLVAVVVWARAPDHRPLLAVGYPHGQTRRPLPPLDSRALYQSPTETRPCYPSDFCSFGIVPC